MYNLTDEQKEQIVQHITEEDKEIGKSIWIPCNQAEKDALILALLGEECTRCSKEPKDSAHTCGLCPFEGVMDIIRTRNNLPTAISARAKREAQELEGIIGSIAERCPYSIGGVCELSLDDILCDGKAEDQAECAYRGG